ACLPCGERLRLSSHSWLSACVACVPPVSGTALSESEQTRIVTVARDLDLVPGDRLHCLELIDCFDTDRRHVVGPLGVKIGRTPPADIVLLDSEVSRSHCFVAIANNELMVSDLG